MKTLTVCLAMTAVSAGFLSGCAGGQKSVPATALATRNSGALSVYSVNLEWQGDATVVSGLIRQTGVSLSPAAGHIDVEVVKPDGRVIYQTRSETIAVPRHIVGKGMKHKSFQIPLKMARDQIDPADLIILKACTETHSDARPI